MHENTVEKQPIDINNTMYGEYDQEIPQSKTVEKFMAPRRRATQQSADTRKTN